MNSRKEYQLLERSKDELSESFNRPTVSRDWRLFFEWKIWEKVQTRQKQLFDAVLCITKTGCQWRQLPKEFPPWQTVCSFFRCSKRSGIWQKVLREWVQKSRIHRGRRPLPTYGIMDSHSVKTTAASEERGMDGEKKIKCRKRHIVTDTQGHWLHVKVHAAHIHEATAGGHVCKEALDQCPSLQGVSADEGYRKTTENFVIEELKKKIEISKIIKNGRFVLAKRWVVERTFAWLNPFRRLAENFAISVSSAKSCVAIAHSMILTQRFKQNS
jgi:putative transposase